MSAGVYRLYSKEYYEDVLSHLTSQGMMSQWLPYYQMTPEAVAMAIETFTHVFPYTVMISGMAEDLILIGAKEPIDFERIGDRFWDDQAVVADLEKHIVSEPLDIYVRVLQTDAQLRRNYADSGLISDKHNHIENMFRAWGRIPRIEYDPAAILREMSVQSPTVAAQMDPIVTHLGRLNFRIPAFPLYEVKKDAAVKYSDADWSRITYEYRQGISLAVKNDPAMAAAAFLRAIELAPENPHIWVYVGQLYEQNGKFVEAEKAFRQVIRTEPKNGTVYALLADTFLKRGLGKQSVEPFKKALVFEPNNLRALRSLAWVLATHPDALVRDADLATRLAAKANDLSDQSNLQILITLAAAYAANEEYLEATRLAEAAILAAEKDGLLEISRTFQGYLESFSRKEPIVDSTLQSG
jgi:tetratricopeptide (TPR) repeat protein